MEARNRMGEGFKVTGGVEGGVRVWDLGEVWVEGRYEFIFMRFNSFIHSNKARLAQF